MLTQDDLLSFIRKNPNHVTYDHMGRLVVRIPSSDRYITHNIEQLSYFQAVSITSSLLHYEDRIPRLPLDKWLHQEIEHISRYTTLNNVLDNIDKFAPILNQGSLILSFCGLEHEAKKLCEDSIKFYFSLASKTNNIYSYIIQPWINLGRLDKILGSDGDALKKFNFLRAPTTTNNALEDAVKQSCGYLDKLQNSKVKSVIALCCVMEPIKILLTSRRYNDLINSFPVNKARIGFDFKESVKLEGHILASQGLQRYHDALRLAELGLSNAFPAMMHIFSFRRLELLYQFGVEEYVGELDRLLQLVGTFDLKNSNLSELNFLKGLANFVMQIGDHEVAKSLYDKCYMGFLSRNDQLGVLESLKSLLILEPNNEYINNKYQQELSGTLYAFIRRERGLEIHVLYEQVKIFLNKVNMVFSMN